MQRQLGNGYLHKASEGSRSGERGAAGQPSWKKGPAPTASPTAGGLTGISLDVTFNVSNQPAASLQAIQVFWGNRTTELGKIGAMTWTAGGKTYDAFVDGGKNSPYVTMSGNAPAHATMPYYLTADEVKNQVSFTKDSGTIKITDTPTAIALFDEAYFETAVVAVNHDGSGKDKIMQAFDWGWTAKGATSTVGKGTKIAGADSGINVKSSVSARFESIVKNDYSTYTHD